MSILDQIVGAIPTNDNDKNYAMLKGWIKRICFVLHPQYYNKNKS